MVSLFLSCFLCAEDKNYVDENMNGMLNAHDRMKQLWNRETAKLNTGIPVLASQPYSPHSSVLCSIVPN